MRQLPVFSRSLLRETLSELALLIPEDLTNYDISLYGPACLLSVGASHKLTSIIDAVAVERQDLLDEAATRVASAHRWSRAWITDRIRGHLNRKVGIPVGHRLLMRLPSPVHKLRVFVPDWVTSFAEATALPLNAPLDRQKQGELKYLMRMVGVYTATDLTQALTKYYSGPCEISPHECGCASHLVAMLGASVRMSRFSSANLLAARRGLLHSPKRLQMSDTHAGKNTFTN